MIQAVFGLDVFSLLRRYRYRTNHYEAGYVLQLVAVERQPYSVPDPPAQPTSHSQLTGRFIPRRTRQRHQTAGDTSVITSSMARRASLPFLAVMTFVIAGTPALALEGRYQVEGHNPGQAQAYRGEAVVRHTGETYSIVWQIGSGRQIGTGLLTGSILSVVFQSANGQGGGVASFETMGDAITAGRWTLIGGQAVGTERWTREAKP